MNLTQLRTTAENLVSDGKGILAADESTATIGERFKEIDVENSEENRRDYRELLFRSEDAMRLYISGVILYDETISQKAKDGTPLIELIQRCGAIPGIKVDRGTRQLAGFEDEVVTEGLDDLRHRFQDYFAFGARFAKWRAVFKITEKYPSYNCVNANAHALARYAALAQEAGLVPIVEPEVLMSGSHNIERCEAVTGWVLKEVFKQLNNAGVTLEGIILKPNMVMAGKQCPIQNSIEEVALATVRTLKRFVPPAVPGIAFLSGGQDEVEATAHLSSINQHGKLPWRVTFSYGRALQSSVQKIWLGDTANVQSAQSAFNQRARMNSFATKGEWRREDDR